MPTQDYHVPLIRMFRRLGEPAPEDGSTWGGTTKADQAWAQQKGERYGPPGHKWDAGHENPASRTPPGERPWFRPQGRSENRAGGRPTAEGNKVRRQDPRHTDPTSPLFTRKLKAKAAKPKAAKPTAAKPKPAKPKVAKPKVAKPKVAKPKVATPEPKVATPEPKPAAPEPKPAPPEPKPGRSPKGIGEPGPVEGLARKLGPLGIIGDALMIRDIAKEIEWRRHPEDPKWGDVRTDMFGQTWYRSDVDPGTWSTRPLPSA